MHYEASALAPLVVSTQLEFESKSVWRRYSHHRSLSPVSAVVPIDFLIVSRHGRLSTPGEELGAGCGNGKSDMFHLFVCLFIYLDAWMDG